MLSGIMSWSFRKGMTGEIKVGKVMKMQALITQNNLGREFQRCCLGIERESLRVQEDATLALTKVPSSIGPRASHPYLLTDFSESQPEFVTPPSCSCLDRTFDWLAALHDVYIQAMNADEYLWPFSMPCLLPDEADIPIIDVPEQEEIAYREYLANHYGKKLQMISGIHFNFSFSEQFVTRLFEEQTEYSKLISFKNALYLKLTRNFLRYHWLITYVYGASPVADESFYSGKKHGKTPPDQYVRSLRNSSYGYNNFSDVRVPLTSVADYSTVIQQLVKDKKISEEREYYGNARLKGYGKYTKDLMERGIKYVEFRSIDVNPFDQFGLSRQQAEFFRLFFMMLVWLDEDASEADIERGMTMNEQVASEHPFAETAFQTEGLRLLEKMTEVAELVEANDKAQAEIAFVQSALMDPTKTYAAQIVHEIEKSSYIEFGQLLAQKYKQLSTAEPYRLRGFDDLEMSTQLLMSDAIERGIQVEFIDRQDQLLKLSVADHIEYVRNGNMTRLDSTISHFLMSNKTATKRILARAGFKVPGGAEYRSLTEAMANYPRFADKPTVIKPKSTNYGVGISIFKQGMSESSYKEALEIALAEDETVLIEDYIAGTEYRFLVIGGVCRAVLLRQPANVIGDGKRTVAELIAAKNQDPLRGEEHRAPLTKIECGQIERMVLKEQGLTFESIPDKDQRVLLRENTNISTGGDSIDMTDDVDSSYKRIAEAMARTMDVQITGIDLIIPNIHKPSTANQPGYTLIEMNYNPAMNMHAYVYKGKGRRVTQDVLNLLFPELPKRSN